MGACGASLVMGGGKVIGHGGEGSWFFVLGAWCLVGDAVIGGGDSQVSALEPVGKPICLLWGAARFPAPACSEHSRRSEAEVVSLRVA